MGVLIAHCSRIYPGLDPHKERAKVGERQGVEGRGRGEEGGKRETEKKGRGGAKGVAQRLRTLPVPSED